ncbi:MAG: hypothetical protein WAN87_04895 [Thermoplasmata archaeon]
MAGSLAGIFAGAIVGYFSENLAQAWIKWYSGNPLEAAAMGGVIAGAFAGVSIAAVMRVFEDAEGGARRSGRFSALLGSLAGVFAGIGGASIGSTLAQSVLSCANGYSGNPYLQSGCAQGILQGSLLFGIWTGAIAGAISAWATAVILSRLRRHERPGSTGAKLILVERS